MIATVNASKTLYDAAAVTETLELLMKPGSVIEVRALDATTPTDRYPHTESGYFDSPETAAAALSGLLGAKGIYFTPNPVEPSLLARVANRLHKAPRGEGTSDTNVIRRRWLLIDCDPRRASGISSTNDEHQAALDRVQAIDLYLHDLGWPDPVSADSGNGAHLLYRIDEPPDDRGLVQQCLNALAARFDDGDVKVDTKVFNPARIWKLYGTLTCKGEDRSDRPHRMARIINAPETPQVVTTEQLEALAAMAPKPDPSIQRNGHAGNGALQPFDLPAFLARNGFDVRGPDPWSGKQGSGLKWTFSTSPMCGHHDDGPHIEQHASGAITAGCHHDSCSWTWDDLRAQFEPKPDYQPRLTGNGKPDTPTTANPFREKIPSLSLAELRQKFPRLKPPVVDGLVREGETWNIIAPPKFGKSWLGYGLAISVITGTPWFGRFHTSQGRVLLVDNELHPETIAHRIPLVGAAMGFFHEDYQSDLVVWSLRGDLRSLQVLQQDFARIQPGEFKLILLDAKYRFCIAGVSENDNAAETAVYNTLDQIGARTGAAIAVIHHATKGNQSGKAITDTGAGAGAQSRAADCHSVLREHEEEGVAVFDAAVRSFPPVEPVALKWAFPIWMPALEADPLRLKRAPTTGDERQAQKDREGMDVIVKALRSGPLSMNTLAPAVDMGKPRAGRLLRKLEADGLVTTDTTTIHHNSATIYRLVEGEV